MKTLNIESILEAYPVLKDYGLVSAVTIDGNLYPSCDYDIDYADLDFTEQDIIDAGTDE